MFAMYFLLLLFFFLFYLMLVLILMFGSQVNVLYCILNCMRYKCLCEAIKKNHHVSCNTQNNYLLFHYMAVGAVYLSPFLQRKTNTFGVKQAKILHQVNLWVN